MNYLENNDYELIYLVSESNENAFDILFKKYEPLIKNIVNHYFYMFQNSSIVKDELEQEGRIGLYKAIKKYDSQKNILFYTFALYCIKKQILNFYVFHFRKKNEILNNCLLLDDSLALIDQDTPEDKIKNNEFSDFIINFKNDLDFLEANIFELKYNSFSYKDIAKILDIEVKTVDNKLVKIKIKLKKYMLKEDLVL